MFRLRRRNTDAAEPVGTSMMQPEVTTRTSPIDGAAQSMLFTLAGSAGLIVAAFLEWIRPDGTPGVEVGYRAYFDVDFGTQASFFRSAGFVAILIGLVAILGMASRSGWITRLAGALAIIAFALFTITLYRADAELPANIGIGPWVLLGGGLLTMFGGLFARRPKVVVHRTAPTA